jgi:hypothetical protein
VKRSGTVRGFEMATGADRYIRDCQVINLAEWYDPYPMQYAFHASPKPHRLLGGAAGPGKTLALINDHLHACSRFSDPREAVQVHTLLLRRTHPKLEATVITRFREKVPKELYRDFNEAKKVVTWLNGATTQFGSMQYEHNAWDWQGQWFKIGYDELAEFTFTQWNATSAWNRCPVSPYCTKDGATNPIGVGAGWIKKLFIDKKPCDEMDEHQRSQYRPEDYEYFPCTYLDNPIYANDPTFIAQLESYPAAIRDALKHGTWGLVGGYFSGAWDPAVNVYPAGSVEIKPWSEKWMSGDWGFEHQSAIYWHAIDELGVIRTYREFVTRHESPETLAESIARHSYDEGGKIPAYRGFFFSHDAFAQKSDANTIALRMGRVLAQHGLPQPSEASRDKIGREQLMYQLLRKRTRVGEDAEGHPIEVPAWQISDACPKLIDCIPAAPRDEADPEKIAEFLGDDPLQGAGYGLYAKLGRPSKVPKEVQLAERLQAVDRRWAAEYGFQQAQAGQASAAEWAAKHGGRVV